MYALKILFRNSFEIIKRVRIVSDVIMPKIFASLRMKKYRYIMKKATKNKRCFWLFSLLCFNDIKLQIEIKIKEEIECQT
jgi:hypothetical protein